MSYNVWNQISFIPNAYHVDTSRSQAGNHTRELQKVKGTLEAIYFKDMHVNDILGSPYLTDRKIHDPERVKDSDKEKEWRQVKTREDISAEIYRERSLRKLNIF